MGIFRNIPPWVRSAFGHPSLNPNTLRSNEEATHSSILLAGIRLSSAFSVAAGRKTAPSREPHGFTLEQLPRRPSAPR